MDSKTKDMVRAIEALSLISALLTVMGRGLGKSSVYSRENTGMNDCPIPCLLIVNGIDEASGTSYGMPVSPAKVSACS